MRTGQPEWPISIYILLEIRESPVFLSFFFVSSVSLMPLLPILPLLMLWEPVFGWSVHPWHIGWHSRWNEQVGTISGFLYLCIFFYLWSFFLVFIFARFKFQGHRCAHHIDTYMERHLSAWRARHQSGLFFYYYYSNTIWLKIFIFNVFQARNYLLRNRNLTRLKCSPENWCLRGGMGGSSQHHGL